MARVHPRRAAPFCFSRARSTASSQALLPLDWISLRWTMVPSGAVRTSTSARGFPTRHQGRRCWALPWLPPCHRSCPRGRNSRRAVPVAFSPPVAPARPCMRRMFSCRRASAAWALAFSRASCLRWASCAWRFLSSPTAFACPVFPGVLFRARLFAARPFPFAGVLFLLLQPFAALVFLALTLAFFAFELLLAFFLFLFQALFLALDGDVGFAGVWLCLPWWGRRGRDRRGFGRLGLRRGRGRRGLNGPGRRLLRHGRPQFGLHGGLVGAAFPVHAPGQGCNQNGMRQHGQRNGAQAAGGRGGANWSRSSWACMRGCEGGLAVSRPA
jgi:hypothetical protein